MPFDLIRRRINEEVAVLGAYRTIAAVDLMCFEIRKLDPVLDCSAVAIGLIPDLALLIHGTLRHGLTSNLVCKKLPILSDNIGEEAGFGNLTTGQPKSGDGNGVRNLQAGCTAQQIVQLLEVHLGHTVVFKRPPAFFGDSVIVLKHFHSVGAIHPSSSCSSICSHSGDCRSAAPRYAAATPYLSVCHQTGYVCDLALK